MTLTEQIAKQLRAIHFGENWTWSNLKEHLSDVDWQQATTKIYSFNTIATLVYHMNYYLNAVYQTLQGNSYNAKHKESFNHPPISSMQDWQKLLDKTWADAESFAGLIEQIPEAKLWENISDKHGNYFTNIEGVIEHSHYHLGQIVFIKKILQEQARTGDQY